LLVRRSCEPGQPSSGYHTRLPHSHAVAAAAGSPRQLGRPLSSCTSMCGKPSLL
jgi:hypothetical protein